MQAVFQGKMAASCPSTESPQYDKAIVLGYVMLHSGTATYWSNHKIMHLLVDDIIAPYFKDMKKELGLPSSQVSIWLINCWSVHRSKEFRAWMQKNHLNIIVLYIPGSCTGVWQPLDVSVQHLLKLSIKHLAHCDIVQEALGQIKANKSVHDIKLDTIVGTLCDRSVGWIVQAVNNLSDPTIITRVCFSVQFMFFYLTILEYIGFRAVPCRQLESLSCITHSPSSPCRFPTPESFVQPIQHSMQLSIRPILRLISSKQDLIWKKSRMGSPMCTTTVMFPLPLSQTISFPVALLSQTLSLSVMMGEFPDQEMQRHRRLKLSLMAMMHLWLLGGDSTRELWYGAIKATLGRNIRSFFHAYFSILFCYFRIAQKKSILRSLAVQKYEVFTGRLSLSHV
jgi:hypothetical protein